MTREDANFRYHINYAKFQTILSGINQNCPGLFYCPHHERVCNLNTTNDIIGANVKRHSYACLLSIHSRVSTTTSQNTLQNFPAIRALGKHHMINEHLRLDWSESENFASDFTIRLSTNRSKPAETSSSLHTSSRCTSTEKDVTDSYSFDSEITSHTSYSLTDYSACDSNMPYVPVISVDNLPIPKRRIQHSLRRRVTILIQNLYRRVTRKTRTQVLRASEKNSREFSRLMFPAGHK